MQEVVNRTGYMDNQIKPQVAVAAIRISSIKQGLQGDSPEDQQLQIERFAANHNIIIKKYFIFIESASKEQQPIQEAIDYCKNPKNGIQLFIIKSIDRFTRGGSYFYDDLKRQLVKYGIQLTDLYGVIGNQQVNTLDHLGIKFNWSVYSPTQKSELLEAERAKDEIRDILTRMIGAEIRYVRMGYRVRPAPFGYVNEKIETSHGKRVILRPHPEESEWIIKMFELRARGTLHDSDIVEEINQLGFKSRKYYLRNPQDRTKIIGERGSKKLNLKHFWRFIQSPIYAGINIEKWTQDQPVKGNFSGLISIELFNKANKGKLTIIDKNGVVQIVSGRPEDFLIKRAQRNNQFAYRRYVLCPECQKPLYASSTTGSYGRRYPSYRCDKRGHYFRVKSEEFDETIAKFVRALNITPEYAEQLKTYVLELWNKRQNEAQKDNIQVESKVLELQASARTIVDKMKFLSSEVAIKYLEEDLIKIENEIKDLESAKGEKDQQAIDMELVMENVKYFLEHFEELLLGSPNQLKKAAYFGLIFNMAPTYQELIFGTAKLAPYIKLKEEFNNGLLPNCELLGIRTQNQYLKRVVLYR